jgi:hypothetical protein
MNITNAAQAPRPTGTHAKRPSFLTRFARECWESNQRIYLSAITDPKTGLADPVVERQVVLMMLG